MPSAGENTMINILWVEHDYFKTNLVKLVIKHQTKTLPNPGLFKRYTSEVGR